jgi:hypothetical protein
MLANILLERHARKADNEPNLAKLLEDAMHILPNLNQGMDVNVKFESVDAFEYTTQLSVFEVLGIPIVHGWIVDPNDRDAQEVLKNLSYNQAAELALTQFGGGSDQKEEKEEEHERIAKALVVGRWLERNSSQLTRYGLDQLIRRLPEGTLAVLFRNNHFSVIHKRNNQLFALVTDSSFNEFPDVMWEELAEIGGDTRYLDSNFQPVDFTKPRAQRTSSNPSGGNVHQRRNSRADDDNDDCILL